jgi:hypothetical protein
VCVERALVKHNFFITVLNTLKILNIFQKRKMYFSFIKFCKSVTFALTYHFAQMNPLTIWPSGGGRAPTPACGTSSPHGLLGPPAANGPAGPTCGTVASRRGAWPPVGTQPPAAVELRHAGKCGALRRASARQRLPSGEQVQRRAGWKRTRRPGRLDAVSFFLSCVICNK